MNKKLGQLLIENNIINISQLNRALKKQKEQDRPLGETLINMGLITENNLLEFLGKQLDIDYINITENNYQLIDRSLAGLLPYDLCLRSSLLPLFFLEDDSAKELTLVMADPLDEKSIKEVERLTGSRVISVLSTKKAINEGVKRLFPFRSEVGVKESIRIKENDDQTVVIVNNILNKAVEMGASDIHLEPHAKDIHLRMRIDGVLQIVSTFPASKFSPIVSRFKVMASEQNSLMKIEEKRVPQDGSFARIVRGSSVDFRVSTFPTIYGEKVVVRVLDKDKDALIDNIEYLNMPGRIERQFLKCISMASGIIIVTGPTGSGKTTTLHAAVNVINDVGVNIVTVEDPVEYHAADYVNQSSLMPQAGYTYPVALRSILRQDPDAILIGEIRDLETAEIAIQAALTGHLVLTTLHTDDSAGAVVRLVDLGIEQFLVSSTVVSSVNQRLLRKVCSECAEENIPKKSEMLYLGIDEKVADEILYEPHEFKLQKGQGCPACRETGYRGRQGVFELLTVTPTIKKLIIRKETSDVIAREARKINNINMIFEEGLRMALAGITSMEELKRLQRGSYEMKSIKKIISDAE